MGRHYIDGQIISNLGAGNIGWALEANHIWHQVWRGIDVSFATLSGESGKVRGSFRMKLQMYAPATFINDTLTVEGVVEEKSRNEGVVPQTMNFGGRWWIVGATGECKKFILVADGLVQAVANYEWIKEEQLAPESLVFKPHSTMNYTGGFRLLGRLATLPNNHSDINSGAQLAPQSAELMVMVPVNTSIPEVNRIGRYRNRVNLSVGPEWRQSDVVGEMDGDKPFPFEDENREIRTVIPNQLDFRRAYQYWGPLN